MALKFRRGTTAQKSGSLAFGEPYVNTDLGTLQIGGLSGDITLSSTGTGSTGNFGAISGSGLDITGNANIAGNLTLGGNITIGDNTTDTVAVTANLSSSLIPSQTNVFDLGSETRIWRDLYISTGSIKIVNPGNNTVVGTLSSNASGDFKVNGEISSSTIAGLGNVTLYSSSVALSISTINTNSSSVATSFSASAASQVALSASIHLTDSTQSNNITINSQSAWGAFQSASAYSASAATALNSVSGAFVTAISASDAEYTSFSASAASELNSVSGAFATTINNASSSQFSTFAKLNGENTFVGAQIISGAMTVTGNVTILGSSSLQNITASAVSIGTNTVILNTDNPGIRWGGIQVVDSGSSGATGSLFWDSTNDVWVYVNPSGSSYASARLLSGPKSLTLGSEVALTNTNVPKIDDGDHLVDSQITDDGTTVKVVNAISASTFTGLGNLTSYSASVVASISASVANQSSSAANALNNYSASAYTTINTVSSSIGPVARTAFSTVTATGIYYTASSGQFNLEAIPNNVLANSSVTINGTSLALGGTLTQAQTINGAISASNQVNGLNILYNSMSIAGVSTVLGGQVSAAQIGDAIGAFSSSAQIDGTQIQNKSITVNGTAVSLGGTLTQSQVLSGSISSSAQVSGLSILYNSMSINGNSVSLGGSLTTAQILAGAISTSAQIDHNATTNYVANQHIDHTSVSITAGSGLSGGGTIAANRTLTLDTASVHFITGSRAALSAGSGISYSNTLGTIAASGLTTANLSATAGILNTQLANSTISGISLGSNLATLTLGNGLTGTSYNGGTAATATVDTGSIHFASGSRATLAAGTGISYNSGLGIITNSGVTSNVAGSGISVSGATGAVTIGNTGVLSNVAGTGVSVSGATGNVTISIGQAVATSSNVQFNSLGIGMAASATAGRIDATNDIVAYSSSDIRFKENIKPIENPIDKIRKISGNTYDWKEENKIEHGYEGNDVGVIAQEIEEVLPQLVQTRESGYKAVKYDKLVALLIEGIKEQQLQIEDLRLEIEGLKKNNSL